MVLDTIETLFSGFTNEVDPAGGAASACSVFSKTKGVTAVITGEQGERTLTRFGLEEYVADCVIFLNHKVTEQIATRRLRIVKYRGSAHGTNEYPFLIDEQGFSVMPISSLGLDHPASSERVSTGVPRLDTMLGGKGYYRGSSILVTGTAGTGKSSMAAHFVDAACRRGERCLYFAFEESRNQIIRNMRSIGIDLEQWVKKGLLEFRNSRPTLYGLEMHLVTMHKAIEAFNPSIVVVDPISNLVAAASETEVKSMLSRLIDYLKMRQITAFCTDLTAVGGSLERTEVGISSLMDTWLLLQVMEASGERNRGLFILKSRGMEHSNQVREFCLTDDGIQLRDVYVGAGGVLTGAARVAQEAKEKAEALERSQEIERKQRDIERKKAVIEAQIAALRTSFEAEKDELERAIAREKLHQEILAEETQEMARTRKADELPPQRGYVSKDQERRPQMTGEAKTKAPRKTKTKNVEERWQLRLYVAGQTPKSIAAFANLKKICEEHLEGKYEIEVIDLLVNPQLAKGDQILAVPTLVRKLPEPVKKIIGDLSNTERVLVGLDIKPLG